MTQKKEFSELNTAHSRAITSNRKLFEFEPINNYQI
jgi:hypothetical protein